MSSVVLNEAAVPCVGVKFSLLLILIRSNEIISFLLKNIILCLQNIFSCAHSGKRHKNKTIKKPVV